MDKKSNIWDSKKKLLIALLVILLLALVGLTALIKYRDSQIEIISYLELQQMITDEKVERLEYSTYGKLMKVVLYDGSEFKTTYPSYEEFTKDMLETGIDVKKMTVLTPDMVMIFVELGFIVFYFILFKNVTGRIGNISETDIIQKSDVKFEQVLGLDEIMDDISLYVSMIKDPHIGDKIGAKLPKGVLLTGDPGTGKTLIAKAIAGEADVPFISVSGSEFQELYKGVGAKRVRNVFKIARKNAPCVIFIDEIDAIGGKRDSDNGDSEDVQTLNQLLKEMDGFKDREGVFVLAATNCPENLDEALKRSGRFDRQVNVMPPRDWRVRKQLLDMYLKDYKVSSEVDTEAIAKTIASFTGADIAMICNEASIVAISKGLDEINRDCIEEAIDKKVFNGNRAKSEQYAKDREIVAYHEAGHAVMKYILGQPISRASIVGTTSGVGGAVFGEDKDGFLRTSKDIKDNILVCYAGRVSERIKYDDVTNGAVNDITKATELIVSSITKFGFDEEIGPIDMRVVLHRIMSYENLLKRVTALGKEYEAQAEKRLRDKFYLVERLANKLLENEIMNGNEIYELLSQ